VGPLLAVALPPAFQPKAELPRESPLVRLDTILPDSQRLVDSAPPGAVHIEAAHIPPL